MRTEQEITRHIMRRVYGIYVLRQVTKPANRLIAFLAVCLVVASSVSMPNVIANALHTSDLWSFSVAAVTGTRFVVQIGILAAVLILAWTVVDLFRAPAHSELSA